MDALREIVLPRLNTVRKSGAGFSARCPAHEDRQASLSVGPGRDHPVVFHCHAGCDPDDILGKLGLTWEDLTKKREETRDDTWTPAGPAIAVYSYHDEAGKLLFQVCRTAAKEFRQRVPDATTKSGWTWKLGDTRKVLYRLPELLDAVAGGRIVYVCEGEKDVHAIVNEGLDATCNPGGAGKWRAEYAEHFRDAIVTIVADRDAPGRAHARQVYDALAPVAAYVEIAEARDGKDVSDHLTAGHGLHELDVTRSTEAPEKADLAPDLWEFLATEDEPFDWIVPDLLERGDRLMLTGFEGLGKSVLIRQIAVTIAAGMHPFNFAKLEPRKVLIIDCENSQRQNRRHLRPLSTIAQMHGRPVPEGGLRIIHRPEGIDLTGADDVAWLYERVTAHKPDVLIIGPFYRLHNANLNDELPTRKVVSVLDKAREMAGCALIIEAHAGHGEAGIKRSVRPTGSSLLLRWPEFGYGLAPAMDPPPGERPKIVEVRPWRGARDDRDWPTHLAYGGPNAFPWRKSGPPEE